MHSRGGCNLQYANPVSTPSQQAVLYSNMFHVRRSLRAQRQESAFFISCKNPLNCEMENGYCRCSKRHGSTLIPLYITFILCLAILKRQIQMERRHSVIMLSSISSQLPILPWRGSSYILKPYYPYL